MTAAPGTARCLRCHHRWPRKGRDTCGPCDREILGRDTIPALPRGTGTHGGARLGAGAPTSPDPARNRGTVRVSDGEIKRLDEGRRRLGDETGEAVDRSAYLREGAWELLRRLERLIGPGDEKRY